MGGDDGRHADAAVEGAEQLAVLDPPRLPRPADDRGDRPAPPVEAGAQPGGQDPGEVDDEPAAGDVREALDRDLLHRPANRTDVDPGRGHQALPEGVPALERLGEGSAGDLEDLSHEREPVRVQAARREPDDAVPGADPGPAYDPVLLDEAEAESGEIEVPARIHPRHLGALPADEGSAGQLAAACDPFDHGLRRGRIEPAHGQVVQEQDGLGALREHVVRAHRHEVDPDRLVARGLHRQPQLGADPVRRGDEHRAPVPVHREPEERREAAHPAEHPGPVRAARDGPDPVDEPGAPVDVHPGIPVAERGRARFGHVAPHPVQPGLRVL